MVGAKLHAGIHWEDDPKPVFEDTEFYVRIEDYEVGDGYCQLQLQMTHFPAYQAVTVNWGDGNLEQVRDYLVYHNYTRAGTYAVRIGREADWFRVWDCYTVTPRRLFYARPQMRLDHWGDFLESCDGAFCAWNDPDHGGLVGTLPRWGSSLKSTWCCFQFCRGVTGGFPKWTSKIEDASGTFERCEGLEGPIPAWGKNIANASQCFSDCPGVTGTFPMWPPHCRKMDYCYSNCSGLHGNIPLWPSGAESLAYCYRNCPGAVGAIPPWPSTVRDLSGCYKDCPNLTGAWTDDPARLMPEQKLQDGWLNRSHEVVTGCADSLRALFWDINWGGTIPRPTPSPEH